MKIGQLTSTLLFTLSVTAISSAAIARANDTPPKDDPFSELDQAMDSLKYDGSKAELAEFHNWKKEYLNEYQQFRKDHFQKMDDIRDNLIKFWGSAEVSSKEELVEYSEDKKVKTVLDFEKNEIRISIIHEKDEKISALDIQNALNLQAKKDQVLSQFVGKTLDDVLVNNMVQNAEKKELSAQSTNHKREVISQEIKVIELQGQAQKNQIERIIDQLSIDEQQQVSANIVDKKQDKVEQENIEKSIEEQKSQIEKETQQRIAAFKSQTVKLDKNNVQKEILKSKKITTYTMPLAHKNALTKADPFIKQVKSQTDRWQLSPSLILAIMHTESYFNPKAQSHVPAYGLMQIVPRTAGIDVNRMLNKKDAPMAEADLFLPNYNITAGVAYMHILNSRYLRKITNPQSRLYCMIAAYNTGSGNVAKTFNIDKSRNINRAAPIINKLSPEEVYEHLVKNLPYDETKHYVQRVVKRQNIYAPVESL
jgi:membrane-bound lytic murein transglycosylase C